MEQGISKMGKIRGELIKGEKKIKKIMVRLRRNQLVFYVVILMVTLMIAFLIVKVFT
jgi:cell division protein FtsL